MGNHKLTSSVSDDIMEVNWSTLELINSAVMSAAGLTALEVLPSCSFMFFSWGKVRVSVWYTSDFCAVLFHCN